MQSYFVEPFLAVITSGQPDTSGYPKSGVLFSWSEGILDGIQGWISGAVSPRFGVSNVREINNTYPVIANGNLTSGQIDSSGNFNVSGFPFYARLFYEGSVSGQPFYYYTTGGVAVAGAGAAAASTDQWLLVRSASGRQVSIGGNPFWVYSGTLATYYPSSGSWVDSTTSGGWYHSVNTSGFPLSGGRYLCTSFGTTVSGGGSSSGSPVSVSVYGKDQQLEGLSLQSSSGVVLDQTCRVLHEATDRSLTFSHTKANEDTLVLATAGSGTSLGGVNTTTQSFAGLKEFFDGIRVESDCEVFGTEYVAKDSFTNNQWLTGGTGGLGGTVSGAAYMIDANSPRTSGGVDDEVSLVLMPNLAPGGGANKGAGLLVAGNNLGTYPAYAVGYGGPFAINAAIGINFNVTYAKAASGTTGSLHFLGGILVSGT
jgi:hypothetical protein